MSNDPRKQEEIHELAGGWITERAGTPIPTFLKMAYVGFTLFALVYLRNYWKGEVDNASRGALVQEFNVATGDPGLLIFGVIAVCVALFAAGLWYYAIVRKPTNED
jgi:hypothetical protein